MTSENQDLWIHQKLKNLNILKLNIIFVPIKKIICKGPYYRPRGKHPHFLSCFPEEKPNDFACIVKHYL